MKRSVVKLFVVGFILCFAPACFGMGYPPPTPTPAPFTKTLLAKAAVDECYNGLGQSYVPGPTCTGQGQRPKANQSYVWGLTKAGDNIWFGTAPNMICLVRAFSAYEQDIEPEPYQTDLWACEFGAGQYVKTQMPQVTVPDVFSDYRPPKIYTYNTTTKVLTDKALAITDPQAQALLAATFGLRSAVAYGNMVLLSGPMALGKGINVFLFDATTGAFKGATTLTQYQNIRKWLLFNNVLYAAVSDEAGGGKVVRWAGTTAAPFAFVEVGILDGAGAEIVAHDGRLFVGTWPNRTEGEDAAIAGLYMSPVVPSTGLTTADAANWKKVWQADKYEPDPLSARIYGMGAMASFGGYLYWGTMHVQGKAAITFRDYYKIPESGYIDAYFNSQRSTAIFRANNFSATPKVELLYGASYMPVYVPKSGGGGSWANYYNKMGGVAGKFGSSGFGNKYNNYTWSMAVYKNQLYVGTMDHSYILQDMASHQNQIVIPSSWLPDPAESGADLWRFASTTSAAVRMSRDGLGNVNNYGFRNMVADDATGLYLGSANPSNIARYSDGKIKGGWELFKVTVP